MEIECNSFRGNLIFSVLVNPSTLRRKLSYAY
jgi:hypothetical protein